MPAFSPPRPARRRLLRRLAAASLVPWLSGCQSHAPLAVASHAWPGYEMMFLARSEGWLPNEAIRLFETASASQSIAALAQGQVQAAALTLDEVLRARAEGQALTVVLVFDISAGADVVVARPEIRQLADLRGKVIGAETSALGALVLAKVLNLAGLQARDVEIRPIALEGHLDAWRSGRLDALVSYEPTAGRVLAAGAHRLIDSRQFPETIFDVLAIRQDAIERHAGAVKTLIGGHFRGLRQLRQNPQDTAYRIGSHLGLPGDDALQAFHGLHLPGLAQNKSLLTANGRLAAVGRELSSLMLAGGLLSKTDDLHGLISDAYLPDSDHI